MSRHFMTARKSPNLIIAGLCAAGLVTGFAARRLSPAPLPVAAENNSTRNNRPHSDGSRKAASESAPELASFPVRHSNETAESLALIPDDRLYAPLALWLADATEPEIAAFWQTYSQKKDRSNDITDLIFLNWTRLDPQAAIFGSSSNQHAWWAWACHDPDAALAEAHANAPDHINHVALGIGEFHPEWLRVHFNELSQGAKDNALRGMGKWNDGQDPLAAIKFQQKIGYSISAGTFKALVRQDPWAALDLVKENKATGKTFGYNFDNPMKIIIDTMAGDRPEDLERLAAQTPSGQLKLQMEAALFDNLLETNPDAALAKAKATTVPRTAAERYAAIGSTLVRSDPEQAFKLAENLFTVCPDALSMMQVVEYPGGSSLSGEAVLEVDDFVKALVTSDPARAVEMTLNLKTARYVQSPFEIVSGHWIERDLPAYANWVNQQTDDKFRARGANLIIDVLRNQRNFAEAADWAMVSSQETKKWQLRNLFLDWNRNDPQGTTDWLDNVDLPADRKKEFRSSITR